MGVPAFFRWLSGKYPLILKDVVEESPTWINGEPYPPDTSKSNPNGLEFDNLYLDMNGIIHPASHPEGCDPPATEDDMYVAVMRYIDRVFAAVRPRKLLYMAIDGVAPRAKMNQQRARRFRAARDRKIQQEVEDQLREEYQKKGYVLPPKKSSSSFDTNVITPGTPFMFRLATYLRAFIHKKVSEDPGWKNIVVILSDASVPGEGEHKIMEHIRLQRTLPGYDANTRHILHGLDADLIMLALATHEPHFTVLREFVGPTMAALKCQLCGQTGHEHTTCKNLTPQSMASAQEQPQLKEDQALAVAAVAGDMGHDSDVLKRNEAVYNAIYHKSFQFLRIYVLREYLQVEFTRFNTDYSCAGGFDLERVIDDFVFFCFFVGNDFLPHLPSLDIHEGAVDTLIDTYRKVFPRMGGYITDNGQVSLPRVQHILTPVGQIEDIIFRDRARREQMAEEGKKRRELEVKTKAMIKHHVEMRQRMTSTSTQELMEAGTPKNYAVLGGDAKMCQMFDEIKDYVDKMMAYNSSRAAAGAATNAGLSAIPAVLPKPDPLKIYSLSKRDRACVHQFCDEMETLDHDSEGEEPNRCIVVKFKSVAEEGDDGDDAVDDNANDNGSDVAVRSGATSPMKIDGDKEDEDVSGVFSPVSMVQSIVGKAAGNNSNSTKAVEMEKTFYKEMKAKLNQQEKISQEDKVQLGQQGAKERYYAFKFGPTCNRKHIVKCYVEGLCWVLRYYYSGVQSWGWYYPYHYAPMASDLVDIANLDISFQLGKPFLPFQQLLCVFPASSGQAVLPESYYKLMSDKNSPILDFYPTTFELDLNGAKASWKAVVLLPFVDESRLLKAIESLDDTLQSDEKLRNQHGSNVVMCHEMLPLTAAIRDLYLPPNDEVKANQLKAFAHDRDGRVVVRTQYMAKIDVRVNKVLSGFIAPYASAVPGRGTTYSVPAFQGIESHGMQNFLNYCIAAQFHNPTYVKHISHLLPTVTVPPPELTALDMAMGGQSKFTPALIADVNNPGNYVVNTRLNQGNGAYNAGGGGGGGGGYNGNNYSNRSRSFDTNSNADRNRDRSPAPGGGRGMNSGSYNSGSYNSGSYNSGSYNSGSNHGSYNNGTHGYVGYNGNPYNQQQPQPNQFQRQPPPPYPPYPQQHPQQQQQYQLPQRPPPPYRPALPQNNNNTNNSNNNSNNYNRR